MPCSRSEEWTVNLLSQNKMMKAENSENVTHGGIDNLDVDAAGNRSEETIPEAPHIPGNVYPVITGRRRWSFVNVLEYNHELFDKIRTDFLLMFPWFQDLLSYVRSLPGGTTVTSLSQKDREMLTSCIANLTISQRDIRRNSLLERRRRPLPSHV
ncbi:uncharacterized protein LOC126336698 [Schistocerca gregaria]|uniref:uncharacterized protein LOC126336698 n=1 Tax=Schistocerca gregaria TaxID=7010 RepID=UPI00211DE716|nr:uncharacterized protein LOC126336698 [Schistocerca gregaria]